MFSFCESPSLTPSFCICIFHIFLTDFDVLGLARITDWEAGDGFGTAVGDPDSVLLINCQMEGRIDLEDAVHPPLSIDQFLTNWTRRFLAHAVSLCPLSMGRSSP